MSVVDASTFIDALCTGGPLGRAARTRLRAGGPWHAPAILPAEVLSAIRGRERRGQLSPRLAERARRRNRATRIVLHSFAPYERRVWALRANLSVYDAWYVALAERLDTPLVTTDGRLARAPGPTCTIDLVEP